MQLLVQIITICLLFSFFHKIGFFDYTFEIRSIVMMLLAAVVSLSTGYVCGGLFKQYLRLGPMIVGTVLGYVFTLMSMAILQTILYYFWSYDLGSVESTIISVIGTVLGTFCGYRLSFLILIAT